MTAATVLIYLSTINQSGRVLHPSALVQHSPHHGRSHAYSSKGKGGRGDPQDTLEDGRRPPVRCQPPIRGRRGTPEGPGCFQQWARGKGKTGKGLLEERENRSGSAVDSDSVIEE
ncbi:hypothetical protein DL764_005934 [Monosporascus ibericus]|uniref:Uncharacterized protein n=1 Tax=Monosporascus ibericus TaxID=155417 RepID=A0A4Q4TAS1_9PEZI|nr:hypothetical protein DL764_005934 [Monosporascus ibericus]